ncbi:TolC family protein [Bacteroides sp. 51]|uniref:TolC family protein n=1 Tax=Bacteroides sp. 51 TaxID=2302938 RepID=UPI0013D82FD5|nr:TolC family protein [Bacteroides sp. 51]NDV84741.1 TolC family protein [Bacteroides sp. 51]
MKKVTQKRCVSVLAGVLGCIISLPAGAQTSQEVLSLTLDQALEVALSENPTIRIADQEITKQGYAKKGTYAALFPQIDLVGSYQRTIEKQTMYMDGVDGMSGGLKVGRDNNWSGGVSATMPLVSVPLWKSLKISAYDVELSVEKARSSRIELIDQVQRSFYSALLARDAYNVYKQAYDNAIYNHKEIKQKYEQGLAAEYDLIRANVNVKNAEPNMYDAENSLILARWQLKALLGLDLESEIECIGTLSDYEENLIPDFVSINTDLMDNSQLKQLDIQHGQLLKTKQMQVAQYYPSLSMQFNYQWNSMNNDFRMGHYRWDPYSILGVNLSIPIFSGGKRYSDVKQTQISIKQLKDQRLDTERNLRLAVKQYTDQMNTCIKQYSAASAGVTEAEKSYVITMKRYETGEGTLLEINDAQLSLTQSQLNLNQSIYNYLVAKSSLEKTLGSEALHPSSMRVTK